MAASTDTSFYFVVRVDCKDFEQANEVMTERLGHDEDYSFEYAVSWTDDANAGRL